MKIDLFTLFPEWFGWFREQRHVRNALQLEHTLELVNTDCSTSTVSLDSEGYFLSVVGSDATGAANGRSQGLSMNRRRSAGTNGRTNRPS